MLGKLWILCISGVVLSTLLSILSHYTCSSSGNHGFSDTADLIGQSVRSALLFGSRWELFAELVEFENFERNSQVFFETCTQFVLLVDISTDSAFIVHSYPEGEINVTSSMIDLYIDATKSTGESYILVQGSHIPSTTNDLLYFSPVKANGSLNSVVVVGIDSSILLSSKTSLTRFVDVVDVQIRLGVDILYTSRLDVGAWSHVYETELFTGLDLSISFSEPGVKPYWFPFFLAAVGGLVSIGIVLLECRHVKTLESSKRRTQFLARMSHEIRTPMNGIIGMSDVLNEEEGVPESFVECVRVISSCSKHLLHLINNILDLSKIESKKIELNPENFKTSLIKEIVHDTWLMTKRDNEVSLKVVYENMPFDAEVIGDTLKIKQVISNLVTNAIKFTNEGSISVYVQWLNLETPGKILVLITVVDTGIGIPKHSMDELFKPYTQMSNNNLGQGTGIGLTISRSLAVALGGGLTCRSNENTGSEFFFKFVVVGQFYEVERADVTSRMKPPETPPHLDVAMSQNSVLALVVDDNKVNVKVLTRILQKLGVTCHSTESGRDAVSMCGQTVYDVVFIDKYMPGYDGLETTKSLRREGLNTNAVIFFCTADVSNDSTRECLMSGGTDCIPKPVTSRQIQQYMSKHRVGVQNSSSSLKNT